MQCTFCSGASRARCASNHAVAPPFLATRGIAHARQLSRMRLRHARSTNACVPAWRVAPRFLFLPLRRARVAAHFYRRAALLLVLLFFFFHRFFSSFFYFFCFGDLDELKVYRVTRLYLRLSVFPWISRAVVSPFRRFDFDPRANWISCVATFRNHVQRLHCFYRRISSRNDCYRNSDTIVAFSVDCGVTWADGLKRVIRNLDDRATDRAIRKDVGQETEQNWNEAKEGKHATTDEKPSIEWSISGRLNGCRRYELPSSRGPGIFVFLVYIHGIRVGRAGLRDRASGKRHGKIYRNPMRQMRRYMYVEGRSKTLEESFDTKNKGSSRLGRRARGVCASSPYVPAGVRLIVVSNRLYSGILIRSQLSELVAYGTNKTSASIAKSGIQAARERSCIYLREPSNSTTHAWNLAGSARHLRRPAGRSGRTGREYHREGDDDMCRVNFATTLGWKYVLIKGKGSNRMSGRAGFDGGSFGLTS